MVPLRFKARRTPWSATGFLFLQARNFGICELYFIHMGFLNTSQKGSVRSIIFKEKGVWFGVALEFNIVEAGTSPQEVSVLLDEAIQGYVEAAHKTKHSLRVLNQNVDPEYESLWKVGTTKAGKGKDKIYRLSTQPINAFA
jgi:predicted RNase H-like HicB family nuclease